MVETEHDDVHLTPRSNGFLSPPAFLRYLLMRSMSPTLSRIERVPRAKTKN